jgi:hypothetical protein
MANFIQWQTSSRNGTTQAIAFTGTSANIASKFGTETWQLRLCSDAACNYSVGDGAQTASTTSTYLAANFIEYVTCSPGQQIAAVRAATDGGVTATSGTLWVTEMC